VGGFRSGKQKVATIFRCDFFNKIPPSRVKRNLKTLHGKVVSSPRLLTASNVRYRAETSQSMHDAGGLQSGAEVYPDSNFKLWVSIAPISRTKQAAFLEK
jgi:hypothetical protein